MHTRLDESIQQAFGLTFTICNGCMLLNVSLVLHFTTEIALPQGHFYPKDDAQPLNNNKETFDNDDNIQ